MSWAHLPTPASIWSQTDPTGDHFWVTNHYGIMSGLGRPPEVSVGLETPLEVTSSGHFRFRDHKFQLHPEAFLRPILDHNSSAGGQGRSQLW